jgi:hypothetical protein
MLKALAAFAAISVNGQINALSTPAPCCSDAVQCEEYARLCLSGNRYYCSILPCTSSSPSVVVGDSCNPCPQGGNLINGKCIDSVPMTADGMCPAGYIFNPVNALCEMSYPPVQFFTDCPSASPSPVQVFEQHSPSTTPNKCCNDATDECMILARRCASGDLTACGYVPCPYDHSSTVPSLCFNPCTKGGIPYAYNSMTKTISCRIVTDAINGTCNSNYILNSDNTCVHDYTTLYSPQSCSPSPSPSSVETRESSSMTPKVVPSSSASKAVINRESSSPLYTRKPDCNFWKCPADYEVTNVNGKVICKYYKSAEYNQITLPDSPEGNSGGFYNEYYCPTGTKLITIQGAVESRKYWCEGFIDAVWTPCPSVSSTPSMTLRIVPSSSASASKVAVERTQSPSMTPKVVNRESSSPSMTPKVVDRESSSPSMTPKIVNRESSSPSMTPKVVDRESSSPSMTPKVVDTNTVERTQSASMTPKVVDTNTVERTQSASMTPKVVDTVVSERTVSPSARPSNVDVHEYTNRPVEPLYTRKPDCNFWSCPAEYEVTNVNGKVICKYYKSAEYDIIDLPETPEGVTGGSWNKYYCPTGTKLITIQGAVEAEKYWCEGFTDAKWLACPSVSSTPTPSMTAKVQQDTYSTSPSMTLRIVPSSSPSNTPKEIVNRESSSPSMTPKVQQDTYSASPSMTPKVEDDTYSASPSNAPCGDWVCPIDLEFVYKLIVTADSRVPICFYETDAEYEIVDYPDTPEGQSGGSTIRYWCKDRRFTLDGSKCVIKTEAEYIPCPSVSSTPSMTYKKQIDASRSSVPSSSPDRSPISDAATTVSLPSRRVSPRISPKFSRFPWFTAVMSKKPLFGTSISGALTFPQASITTIDKIKELQVHLSCMFHVDIEKVSITSIVRYINGTKFNVPFDISVLSTVEVPLVGCYKTNTSSPALARMLQSVNGDIVVNYVMTDPTAEILSVDPTVLQSAIASDPAIVDFASSVGSTTINSSANMNTASSEDGISTSNNNNANFGAITGIAVVFGAILAVVGVVGGAKYAQHRKRVAKNSKVIRFEDESPRRNPLTYDTAKQMFTPTPALNYIV